DLVREAPKLIRKYSASRRPWRCRRTYAEHRRRGAPEIRPPSRQGAHAGPSAEPKGFRPGSLYEKLGDHLEPRASCVGDGGISGLALRRLVARSLRAQRTAEPEASQVYLCDLEE